jgi:hypothetical protein
MKHLTLKGTLREALCELLAAWTPTKWYERVLRTLLIRRLECNGSADQS